MMKMMMMKEDEGDDEEEDDDDNFRFNTFISTSGLREEDIQWAKRLMMMMIILRKQ